MATGYFSAETSARTAKAARREGLGAARGLVNGIIFTTGLWLAITGGLLLVFR